jgi:hypothetical protein
VAAASASHRRVLSSISVKRKVTVPVGLTTGVDITLGEDQRRSEMVTAYFWG